ncbi:MAG: serine hydroxymethyltransferase, partial [Poseidonibacter sp.]
MNFISNANLETADNKVFQLCQNELERQTDHLEMIASENFTSP